MIKRSRPIVNIIVATAAVLLPSLAFGALSASTVWEVRPSGADTNGGGFVSGASGTDYSQQDSAPFSGTDLASTNGTNASPTVTSATHNFVSTDVGNIIQITAGTSWTTGFYQIVSVNSNAATLDRACGSSASLSGGTWAEGGALASIGECGSGFVSGNILYINNAGATVYSLTSATYNVSGGCFGPTAYGSVIGYSTNRTITNTDAQPTIQLNVASGIMFGPTAGGGGIRFYNLIFDGNSQTSSRCFASIQAIAQNCTFKGFTGTTVIAGTLYGCKITGNSTGSLFGTNSMAFFCEAYANTATPMGGSEGSFVNCVSYNNTGATTDGFHLEAGSIYQNCVAYGNGRYGFNTAGGNKGPCIMVNCIAEGNTTGALGQTVTSVPPIVINFAYDSGFNLTGINTYSTGVIHYTNGSVFNNPAGNDFSLNNIAGRGALLRAAGFATFPAGVMVGYPDIGAVQSGSPVPTPTPTPTPTPNPTIQVTVQTTPAGRAFNVDGADYSAAQIFSWTTGSTHTIATTTPQSDDPSVRYYFSSWSDGGAISHTVTPTKNTTYTAKFGTQYYLTISAGTGGHVSPASSWRSSGSTFSISATPSTNYSFSNWTGSGSGSYTGTDNPRSITMLGPITEAATFTHN